MPIAIDTSAVTAIVFGEPEAEALLSVMLANIGDAVISAATLVEATIVIESRQGPSATQDLYLLLEETRTATVPLDGEQAELASAAWRRFGKGNHEAALDLGDCYSYALSKATGFPLLYKGRDFPRTDVLSAL
ncbi:MAG TPA: type II toxin-antitoxin system VapC family toxin [Trueperaceae bacterium]|nr:type II toxin-antitoxin system VapC family toxin [Trueperaceae bacterium]